jgi:hypothetical protein
LTPGNGDATYRRCSVSRTSSAARGRTGVPAYVTFAELEERLPGVDARFVEKAATLGVLEVEGDRL